MPSFSQDSIAHLVVLHRTWFSVVRYGSMEKQRFNAICGLQRTLIAADKKTKTSSSSSLSQPGQYGISRTGFVLTSQGTHFTSLTTSPRFGWKVTMAGWSSQIHRRNRSVAQRIGGDRHHQNFTKLILTVQYFHLRRKQVLRSWLEITEAKSSHLAQS